MKKFIGLVLLFVVAFLSASSLNKTKANEEIHYKYKIVSNSNSLDDILKLYETKELLVINYNNALENELLIQDVYLGFSEEKIRLENNIFIIVIGEGNGISLEGSLRTNRCDDSTINNRYALLEWLSNLK
ncbi:MAG: hypothetical protein IJV94_00680 [Bacilli bacterium]|nr:hypothetical protein [Bacilli bacterium]